MHEATMQAGQPTASRPDATTGTVDLTVPIEGDMPEAWYGIFVDDPPGVILYEDLPEMRFSSGEAVYFTCRPDQIGRFVEHVRQRVESANRIYNTDYMPKERAKREREAQQSQDAKAEAERLQAEANRAIENL